MSNKTHLNPREEMNSGTNRLSLKENLFKIGVPLCSIVTFLLVWWLITRAKLVNPMLLPEPAVVFNTFLEMLLGGNLLKDTFVSLLRVVQGFVLAGIIAIPIGMLMGMSRFAFHFIDPIIEILRPIPPIAFIPLAIMWFGIGESSKIFIISYGAFFPILINTFSGFMSVEEIHIRAAKTLGANKWHIFRDVTFRSAFPDMIVGLRLGLGMAFIVLVAAELIASDAGLGYLIQDARSYFRTDRVIVGMGMIGILGFLLNKGLVQIEKKIVKWKPRG